MHKFFNKEIAELKWELKIYGKEKKLYFIAVFCHKIVKKTHKLIRGIEVIEEVIFRASISTHR